MVCFGGDAEGVDVHPASTNGLLEEWPMHPEALHQLVQAATASQAGIGRDSK